MDIKLSKTKGIVMLVVMAVCVVAAIALFKLLPTDTHKPPAQVEKKDRGPEPGVSRKGLLFGFKERKSCPACGASKRHFYRKLVWAGDSQPKMYRFHDKGSGEIREGTVTKNHFDVVCSECKFGWLERVKDDPWNE